MNQLTKNTALLILDMQEQLLGSLPNVGPLIQKVSEAIAYARRNSIPVIYIAVGFRKHFPEIHPDNKSFARSMATLTNVNMEQWTKIHPSVSPEDGEPVVIKKRVSAFAGSDLEMILR
jgi:nicotinamidase-related amidase